MGVAMHDKPAIAFRIRARLIKMMGFLRQAPYQRPMALLVHRSQLFSRIAIMPEASPPVQRIPAQPQPVPRPEPTIAMTHPVLRSLWPLRPSARLLGVLGLSVLASPWAAMAAPQPALNQDKPPRTCPALLPGDESFLEPIPLSPREVPAKNAKGCLSPGDAIYGPDGCPKKLCPQPKGLGL